MYRLTEFDIPILEAGQEGILAKNGDFTVCFEIIKPPLFTLSAPQIENTHQSWTKAVRILLPGTILHLQDSYIDRDGEEAIDEQHVGDEDYRYFTPYAREGGVARKYLRHACYCFVTRRNPNRKTVYSGTSSLISGTIVPEYVSIRP